MTEVHAEDDSFAQPPAWPITDDAVREVFAAMLQDGSWGRYHGPHCDRLIEALAEFHAVEHVILCSSGTSAVELALRAANVQPGDEVILAAYDYKANFVNVLTLGAMPVLVDTLPGVPVLDPSQLAAVIGPKTRAVICSHLHGSFAAIDEVMAIAAQHQIVVIEDACQTVGGILNGRAAGSIGDIGVLSFGGSKLLTAGRGGAILTNNATLAQRIRLYTQRGNDAYPLSEMQAAVLLPQLRQLTTRTTGRLANVLLLQQCLSDNTDVALALDPALLNSADTTPAFYKLAFRFLRFDEGTIHRENFTAAMRQQGVALDPGFPCLHRIHSARRFRAFGDLTQADLLHDCLMTLHHPILLSDEAERIRDLARLIATAT
mgnify:FL=1